MTDGVELGKIYERRFGEVDESSKNVIWSEIATFLQRWIPPGARVLDVACDKGYFIRHIRAAERWATDVRDMGGHVGEGVQFVQCDGLMLSHALPAGHFDVVFMSNYLEHLPSADAVIVQLREANRVLRADGRLIVLQPNIKLVGDAYWDFIDHRVAITDRSLVEAAHAAGFEVEHMIVRFLPYTTKRRLPCWRWLVSLYLRLPIAWWFMGKQTLLIARPVQS